MKYSEFEKLLRAENKDLFDKIFENNKFSFDQDIMIDDLSMYNGTELIQSKEDAEKFGCKIHNNEVRVPANLAFTIYKYNNSEPVLFYIKRNEVEYPISYMDSNDEINVEFTEFGHNLYKYAENTYTSLTNAYQNLIEIENIFKVHIVN